MENLIEKNGDVWKCKVCAKTSTQKRAAKYHAETHMGVYHVCHICSKKFATTMSRKQHISAIHSALFSCDDCAKTGMNRKKFRHHKQIYHKIVSIKQ